MRELVAAIVGPGHALAQAERKAVEGEAPEPQSAALPAPGARRDPVLKLSAVVNDRLRGVDLTLAAGEIHGLAGLVGSGRTEILQTIFGLRPVLGGDVTVVGTTLKGCSPAEAIARGIAFVPEDRHVQGLVLEHSIERNLVLPQLPLFSNRGWLRHRASLEQARVSMNRLAVKAPGPSTIVKNLSGGNQQKVVFAKWNHPQPRVLLLDEPTVGVDVGAREEIYGLVRAAARDGTGVLVVSSDLGELLLLCDRLSIVADGRVVATVERSALAGIEDLHHRIQTAQADMDLAA